MSKGLEFSEWITKNYPNGFNVENNYIGFWISLYLSRDDQFDELSQFEIDKLTMHCLPEWIRT